MPVITFFQTKGGTGKTTSAFLLAELLGKGSDVTVIEADQNKPFTEWVANGGEGQRFGIITALEEDEIVTAIEKASRSSTFVIVDCEGSANMTAARAASVSDLVIVTSNGKPLDQRHAAKAIKYVKDVGKRLRREIPIRVLLTLQPAVARSRTLKQAEEDMREHGISVFNAQLINRDAFAAIFGYCTTLFQLDPKKVNDPSKAYFNARAYANEVLRTLKAIEETEAQPEGQGGKPDRKEVA
jgi:chromosome partitioning protein